MEPPPRPGGTGIGVARPMEPVDVLDARGVACDACQPVCGCRIAGSYR